LEQAVLNLLDNAVKYAQGGRHLTFILAREPGSILLKVQDDGPGIPESAKARIFEKFFRADTSLTAPQPGSGLGLSISRRMIRDLGGDIYLEAGQGRGACFTIRIPSNERD